MKHLATPARHALPVALAILLSACGGSSAPDPMQEFRTQTLSWRTCDPSILGDPDPDAMKKAAEDFALLGERVKCADMRAPMDHADPSKGEVSVALLRVVAEDPKQRAGAIFFNPGGPGQDGLGLAVHFGALWTGAAAVNPAKLLSNRYDLIGFSPRGVGASTRLYCASNEMVEEVKLPSADRSEKNIQNMLHNARLKADACRKNPLSKYINTEQTVRDMDLARHLLGDSKFNYIGYSYGTWLGAWYASRFPERVGRMLLDSNMNFAATFDDAGLLLPMGFQRIFEQVLTPYAARHNDKYKLGTSSGEVRGAYDKLPTSLKAYLRGMPLNKSNMVEGAAMMLAVANYINVLLEAFPLASPDALLTLFHAQTFSSNSGLNDFAHFHGQRMFQSHFASAFVRYSVSLVPEDAVFQTVSCSDTPGNRDPRFWADAGNAQAASYPLRGGAVTEQPCIYWDGPVVAKPPLSATANAAPILMLQSQYDGPTPAEGAMKAFAAMPNSGMIYVENEYSHGVFPYSTACVDQAVVNYFISGAFPGRGQTLTCPGKPLAGDAPLLAADISRTFDGAHSVSNKATQQNSQADSQAYEDPARAAAQIEAIHRIVGNGARQGF